MKILVDMNLSPRSLSGLTLLMDENAKKRIFGAFSTLQTPKGAHKSENFAAICRKILQVRQAPRWAGFLNENGIEAVHWSFIGSPDAHDSEIMTYAKTYDFTVLTNDFGYILAITCDKKPSVIQMRIGVLGYDRIGALVLSAIKLLAADIDNGALVTIDQRKTRVTLLPL